MQLSNGLSSKIVRARFKWTLEKLYMWSEDVASGSWSRWTRMSSSWNLFLRELTKTVGCWESTSCMTKLESSFSTSCRAPWTAVGDPSNFMTVDPLWNPTIVILYLRESSTLSRGNRQSKAWSWILQSKTSYRDYILNYIFFHEIQVLVLCPSLVLRLCPAFHHLQYEIFCSCTGKAWEWGYLCPVVYALDDWARTLTWQNKLLVLTLQSGYPGCIATSWRVYERFTLVWKTNCMRQPER